MPKRKMSPEEDARFKEYQRQRSKRKFAIKDTALRLDRFPDMAATYVKADKESERIWIVARPCENEKLVAFAINPDAAFILANAILEQGDKAGWYHISHVDGMKVPDILQ